MRFFLSFILLLSIGSNVNAENLAKGNVEVAKLCVDVSNFYERIVTVALMGAGPENERAQQILMQLENQYVSTIDLFEVVAGPEAMRLLNTSEQLNPDFLGRTLRCARFGICDQDEYSALQSIAQDIRKACTNDYRGE